MVAGLVGGAGDLAYYFHLPYDFSSFTEKNQLAADCAADPFHACWRLIVPPLQENPPQIHFELAHGSIFMLTP